MHRSPLSTSIADQARRLGLWAPGTRLGLAVSGGADSVAMLELMAPQADAWGLSLAVVHVDHGWRADSGADAAFVGELARRHGLPFYLGRGAPPPAGSNREQHGRRLRYGWFARLIGERRLDRVATAHTADDQAETVLLRLLRGAGTAGLAGILPQRPPGIVRPFLATRRTELRDWLRAQGQPWREDASNADLGPTRNRLRHAYLPALQAFNPQLVARLCALGEVARAEEEYWRSIVDPLASTLWQLNQGEWTANQNQLRALPLGLRRRLLRWGLARARGHALGPDFQALEHLLAALNEPPRRPRSFEFSGAVCRLQAGRLQVSRVASEL